MNEREHRRMIAEETLRIIRDGQYTTNDIVIDISDAVRHSREDSILYTQDDADRFAGTFPIEKGNPAVTLADESTLSAIHRLQNAKSLGVLNFASAKNPGGGFMNGAWAQEESLAIASNLYNSQINQQKYYETNRACRSMMYTDTAIWSPDVVFFRDDDFILLENPSRASVLTLPAVNMGQVLLKGEDPTRADVIMFRRMGIALGIFADRGCDTIILGAYGCGVFRNDPYKIAVWWKHLLRDYSGSFKHIHFAVLDRSRTREVMSAFESVFGESK